VMAGTEQTPLWVTVGVRQGGLPARTDEL